MENSNVEYHPLAPFLPPEARLLMLGSFPPPRARWNMEFFYPNLQNDMWRIVGLVCFGDKEHFLDGKSFDQARIRAFCRERGIALSDTARAVVRLGGNASDDLLRVVEPADVAGFLRQLPLCRDVAVTGRKAMDTLKENFAVKEPKVGDYSEFVFEERRMRLWRMPSSSRAYPLAIGRKAESYAAMFRAAGLC